MLKKVVFFGFSKKLYEILFFDKKIGNQRHLLLHMPYDMIVSFPLSYYWVLFCALISYYDKWAFLVIGSLRRTKTHLSDELTLKESTHLN